MVIDTVALEKGLRVEFNRNYSAMLSGGGPEQAIMSLATTVPSGAASEKYGWLGDVPVVKEWIGEKTAESIEDYDYTILNKDWYNAVEIDRNELDDDQMGIILPRIQMLAQSLAWYKTEMIENLVVNGITNLAYDGAAFFANRTAPNDNLLAGTGPSQAQIKADINTARIAMMRFTSDQGRVMRLRGNVIVCPPEMEGDFLEVVTSQTPPTATNNGVANPVRTWIDQVISLPALTDVNDWYMFATQYPLKPFIFQDRRPVSTVLDDTQVKSNRKLIYSGEMRGNAGYGFFQMGVKVVNT